MGMSAELWNAFMGAKVALVKSVIGADPQAQEAFAFILKRIDIDLTDALEFQDRLATDLYEERRRATNLEGQLTAMRNELEALKVSRRAIITEARELRDDLYGAEEKLHSREGDHY